ncbi:MAG: BON domain-containing protein [Planctomycetota bacterium]
MSSITRETPILTDSMESVSIETDPCLDAASAIAALASSSVAELRFLRVDESEEQICLTGHVGSFYHKQLAQETIRPLAAGRRVINRVRVEA